MLAMSRNNVSKLPSTWNWKVAISPLPRNLCQSMARPETDYGSRTEKGLHFLRTQCHPVVGFQNGSIGKCRSEFMPKVSPPEVFTSAVALDLLRPVLDGETTRRLLNVLPNNLYGSLNFYPWDRIIPNDLDTTALVHFVLLREGYLREGERLDDLARLLYLNRNRDGVLEAYFPPRGHRQDRLCPVTMANVLRLLYAIGLDGEVLETENYLWNLLVEPEGPARPSTYYPSTDVLLYHVARAIVLCPRVAHRFRDIVGESVQKRLGTTAFPIDISARVLAIAELGIGGRADVRAGWEAEVGTLRRMQGEDGSWPADALIKMGRHGVYFGGSVISTIYALGALRAWDGELQRKAQASKSHIKGIPWAYQ